MKVPLIAIKQLKHAGRRYAPGDRFVALRRDARILIALKRARRDDSQTPRATERRKPEPRPEVQPQPEAPDLAPAPDPIPPAMAEAVPKDISKLTNAELKAIAAREGVPLNGRETKAELIAKITENRHGGGSYQRRDMRAEG